MTSDEAATNQARLDWAARAGRRRTDDPGAVALPGAAT